MATVLTYNDFRYGMVSEKMRRRVDLAVYQKSAALIENLVPMRTGGVRLRPGTVFEADLTEMKAERIIPFVISVREHYIVVLSSGRLYILGLDISGRYENQTGEGFVTEYTSSEIKEIQVAQNNDLMILVQRNHPPFALQKGAEGGWQAGTINLDVSTDAYNYAYDEDGNETKSALLYDYQGLFTTNNFPSVAAFCANRLWLGASVEHPYRMWASKPFEPMNFQTEDYYNYLEESASVSQYMDAIAGAGETSEILKEPVLGDNQEETAPGEIWQVTKTVDSTLGIVVSTNGIYEYHKDGSIGTLLGHREYDQETNTWGDPIYDGSDKVYTFSYTKPVYSIDSTVVENSALMLDMASDRDESISWIAYSGDSLFVGTASSEWVMPSSINALSPSISKIASYGSAAFKQSCYGVKNIFYIQSGGKLMRSIAASAEGFSFIELTYQCDSILSAGVAEMAWQRVPEPRLYCILSDGSLAVLCYDIDYDINAWCRWTFPHKAKSIAVIDTEEGQTVFIIFEDEDGALSMASFKEGVYLDIAENFTGHLITNNLDSSSSMFHTKKAYQVGVDSMRTRFSAGVAGASLSKSYSYDRDLIKLDPWTNPNYNGLRYEFKGFEGEDMVLLAVMIETEASA